VRLTYRTVSFLTSLVTVTAISGCALTSAKANGSTTSSTDADIAAAILWTAPSDIGSRDLFDGPGGIEHRPQAPYEFIDEDATGSNPKFRVRDAENVIWTVKLGEEAKPETAATRLVWAVGYVADEDYFLRDVQVRHLTAHLHRGADLIGADGTVHNVRLKREPKGRHKLPEWRWRDNPFLGSRPFNGLRTLMAVVNNWDLKDVNNACFMESGDPVCEVKDLGGSFGSGRLERTREAASGNLLAYAHSHFVTKVTPTAVDFDTPRRPAWIVLLDAHQFFMRLPLESIGRNVPRKDARWMGDLLGQLSLSQLQDAFRAAGYEPSEIDGFVTVLQKRIAQLRTL
jgi:hypothetical protein